MAARDGGTSRDLNERLVEPIDSAEALRTPLPPVTERYFEKYYAMSRDAKVKISAFCNIPTTQGGQKLTPSSPLCFVHCGKDKKYCLYSCIKGYLVEVNEQLLANPSLLRTNPIGDGYLALVLPKLEDRLTICDGLLSEEDYRSIRTQKKQTSCADRSDSHSTSNT